jgi:hypothetical protein
MAVASGGEMKSEIMTKHFTLFGNDYNAMNVLVVNNGN